MSVSVSVSASSSKSGRGSAVSEPSSCEPSSKAGESSGDTSGGRSEPLQLIIALMATINDKAPKNYKTFIVHPFGIYNQFKQLW